MTTDVNTTAAPPRALAPDIARGLMLLMIALANAPWYAFDVPRGVLFSHATDAAGTDRVWQVISIIAIDARSYPLFAFLFGYGIWQLHRRQRAAGVDDRAVRRVLRRRHLWMIAFGAVHALLLWYGDIVGAYGLVGLIVVAALLGRSDRALRITAWVLAGLIATGAVTSVVSAVTLQWLTQSGLLGSWMPVGDAPFDLFAVFAVDDYGVSMAVRLAFWAVSTVGQLVALTVPLSVVLGMLAARRGLLDAPQDHRRILRGVALGGIAVGWAGGAVTALQFAGILPLETAFAWGLQGWHALTGVAGGIGYAAAFGLLAVRMHPNPGLIGGALQAVGKRSLSCYLAQSVILAPLLSAWGLGLGYRLPPLMIAAIAVATWLVTVVGAVVLERAGKRGPAESLLRRLSYRSTPEATPIPVAG
ncbi:DUF418 domain-containing protein [Microbacterium sp.]|uniref:DUF418 domain-containing protein n=1 Tax=Microbacterium sp. TaxID=51671 RepID=UPI003A869C1E